MLEQKRIVQQREPKDIHMKTLLITGNEVEDLLDMSLVLEAADIAFREKASGNVQMPAKTYLYYQKDEGDLRIMPSYLPALDVSAVKIVNVHPRNARFGLKTVMASIMLIDPQTGFPIALMDGSWITAMRTGATSGLASKYLARHDSRNLGLIGAGVQARTQLTAILHVQKIKEVKVYDIDSKNSKKFVESMSRALPDLSIDAVSHAREAVEDVDILCTVTPAKTPIVKDDWVKEGLHINAIGADAPGKRELETTILARSRIVVDDYEQAIHSGEINLLISMGLFTRDDIHGELAEIVAGKKIGRSSADQITVFDSTGIAILDAMAARIVYKKALDMNIGRQIDLIS